MFVVRIRIKESAEKKVKKDKDNVAFTAMVNPQLVLQSW
jgi:hypothetical protein